MTDLFDGFQYKTVAVDHDFATAVNIHVRIGGKGPALLLIHGYPQTGAMWHKVAAQLAERFTVICPDLRGYGASDKPESDETHLAYSKRAMAADMAALMTALGHERFQVAGHDRGARVTHRLCLDHSERVIRASLLDIVPTRTFFREADHAAAHAYYHWYFLAQPYPLPETLIGADPVAYLRAKTGEWSAGDSSKFDPAAQAEYEAAFSTIEVVHASCEDYRAAASIDLEHDEADLDRKIECPLLVLWGKKAPMERHFDVLDTWRDRARAPQGFAIDSGHFLAEENPEATLAAFLDFFEA